MSPSMRRAWIEIARSISQQKEIAKSPSMRRAWIEIPMLAKLWPYGFVALYAEGVD